MLSKHLFWTIVPGWQIWSNSKFWEIMLGAANVVRTKVLNKFAWGSKFDRTLTIQHVCSGSKYKHSPSFKRVYLGSKMCKTPTIYRVCLGIANKIKVKLLNKFTWGGKCDKTFNIEHVCPDSKWFYNESPSFKQDCYLNTSKKTSDIPFYMFKWFLIHSIKQI